MSTEQADLSEFEALEESEVLVTSTVSRGSMVYHTDPECQFVSDSHKSIPLSNAKMRGLDVCSYCADEIEPATIPEPEQCGAQTTKGHLCRQRTMPGFDRCSTHLDFGDVDETDDSRENDDRPVWERKRLGDSSE